MNELLQLISKLEHNEVLSVGKDDGSSGIVFQVNKRWSHDLETYAQTVIPLSWFFKDDYDSGRIITEIDKVFARARERNGPLGLPAGVEQK